MNIQFIPLSLIDDYDANSNTHPDAQLHQIESLMQEVGWTAPALLERNGERYRMIAGHGRKQVAAERFYASGKTLRMADKTAIPTGTIPALLADGWTPDQVRMYVIADNRVARNSIFDEGILEQEIKSLQAAGIDLNLLGFDDAEINDFLASFDEPHDQEPHESAPQGGAPTERVSLAERFMIPPFSTFNAREGWWMNRKKSWLALGIKSEAGRGESGEADSGLLFATGCQPPEVYDKKQRYEQQIGKVLSWAEFHEAQPDAFQTKGTSIFDPVLCEIIYRWFAPSGGTILDPFAGGSVRGIVAAKLGLQYIGHELRGEQVAENRQQAADICAQDDIQPIWVEGDSRLIQKTCQDVQADLIFSCPPYADLEVYSDNPKDISTLKYAEFKEAYLEIINNTCALLKENAFACFVVGEVRDKKGNYYNFVGDTIDAFIKAGLHYYNEGILITNVGSLPIRMGKAFSTTRKLGKTHQNILIFVKGDARKATDLCGDVDVNDALEQGVDSEIPDPATKYGAVM
jgi:DNA modification methylase